MCRSVRSGSSEPAIAAPTQVLRIENVTHGAVDPRRDFPLRRSGFDFQERAQMRVAAQQLEKLLRRAQRVGNAKSRVATMTLKVHDQSIDAGLRPGCVKKTSQP